MSWHRNSRVALAALIATTATAAAANVLVVRSSGPSAAAYKAGRSLPENARITLRQGDTVIVLTGAGTRTFRGPGTFSPNSAVRAGPRLATAADGRRARVGAVRNAGVLPRGGTIWDVDVSQSGTFCVVASRPVLLWRADASLPISLQIITHDGASRTVQWAAGQPTLAWPAGTQMTNGAAYSFRTPGVAVPTQITFRTLASEPGDLEGVAAALIENGCDGQLDLLIETQPAAGS